MSPTPVRSAAIDLDFPAPELLREIRSVLGGGGAAVPVAAPEDWARTLEVLAATASRRDGDAAARHTAVRQRMRALARAALSLGRKA